MTQRMPSPDRTSHPFFMYEMIRDIPAGFDATLGVLRRVKPEVGSAPLFFTGNGTAYFASVMGSQLLALSQVDWKAVQAFELANYEQRLRKAVVIGVSHSGITKSTLDALKRAKSAGSQCIGIAHFPQAPISRECNRALVIGNGPDKSRCHTKTYVDSAAAVAKLALDFSGADDKGNLAEISEELQNGLLKKIKTAISVSERPAKIAAHELRSVSKVFFAGAGPNVVTAREAALKIKESSFLPSEGVELEEILHGPWMTCDMKSLIVAIAPSGPSTKRTLDLIAAARRVGAKTMVVSDSDFEADYVFRVPKTLEYLSPFLTIIPLYFLAYFLALEHANNPDLLRYLEPKYWSAREVIFPPGTH